MSDIKAAMDKIAHETMIEIEAPSKKSMTKDEVEHAKKSFAEEERQKKLERVQKMKEAKQLLREEKIRTGKSTGYKSKTAILNSQLDSVQNQLSKIIERFDKKEEESGVRAPVTIKKEAPIEKPEPKVRHPDSEEAEKVLHDKNPLTPDPNKPAQIEQKTPEQMARDSKKAFAGYNKRAYYSIHQVPSIKPKNQ